jgi:uncharacterized protein YqhQ
MESKITIGGQAVIEGVMMRSDSRYAICVRKPDGKISTRIVPIKKNKAWYNTMPVIRGCVRFFESLRMGVDSLEFSATESQGEDSEKIRPWELGLAIFFSLGITIVLFYVVPLFLARLLTDSSGILFNLLDGLIRLSLFVAYLLLISLMPDIRRVFQYHGAEHKTVHCYENKEKLTVKNVQKYTTLHPRCGTSFILIVFIMSIVFFSFIQTQNFAERLGLRLLLLPIIAGISYEALRASARHLGNPIVKVMVFPGLMLQKITTRQPDDRMVEIAIKSLKSAL